MWLIKIYGEIAPSYTVEKKKKDPILSWGWSLMTHTPSITFRHFPPNSARFSYATESALYRREVVHRHSQPPPKGRSGTDKTVEAT